VCLKGYSHSWFSVAQAVVLGNYVMAALTDGDRSIKADPAKIAEAVTEISQVFCLPPA